MQCTCTRFRPACSSVVFLYVLRAVVLHVCDMAAPHAESHSPVGSVGSVAFGSGPSSPLSPQFGSGPASRRPPAQPSSGALSPDFGEGPNSADGGCSLPARAAPLLGSPPPRLAAVEEAAHLTVNMDRELSTLLSIMDELECMYTQKGCMYTAFSPVVLLGPPWSSLVLLVCVCVKFIPRRHANLLQLPDRDPASYSVGW